MTDIHTHILPGVDDGSQDTETSLMMLRIAADCGTSRIVLTPHCGIEGEFDNFYDDALKESFAELCGASAAEGIPVELFLGMEVYLSERLPQYIREHKAVTLNNSHYMLVEMAFDEDPRRAARMLGQVSSFGITPIIAHPERYFFAQSRPQILYDWVQSGSLLQLNKGSLYGRFGRNAAILSNVLLDHNLVHFIASDCHSINGRTPDMTPAVDIITEYYRERYARELFSENPESVLLDRDIEITQPISFG